MDTEAAAAAAAASTSSPSQCPPEHRDWVEGLRHGLSSGVSLLQRATSQLQEAPNHSWCCPSGDIFSVRGADFHQSRRKIPGGQPLLHPLAFDFLQGGPSPIAHIMNHPHCRVRNALDAAIRSHPHHPQQPFVWAFNLQLGNNNNHSMVCYYVSFSSPPQGSLMQKFLDGDDAFRNARLKGLLSLPEAPRLVQMLVGNRLPVCMVGKFMRCNYIRGKHYMEVDVDVASSMLLRTAMKLTFGLLQFAVTDIAFVLEGIHPDELPEKILGAARLVKLNPSSATHFNTSV